MTKFYGQITNQNYSSNLHSCINFTEAEILKRFNEIAREIIDKKYFVNGDLKPSVDIFIISKINNSPPAIDYHISCDLQNLKVIVSDPFEPKFADTTEIDFNDYFWLNKPDNFGVKPINSRFDISKFQQNYE